ncbi:hypothetical protein STRINF_01563 [Streptococcus infantarius subsp. infantarius ATCC BAA-102]|uniref:Uncharacterized protein n=1 Tax=Streptococcus infantarius subsp. infantarius ATCC BAA-102 TaxID=471872 RepID=A0ABP2DJE6_9STRE|nr:hypothetical protein STRINF_01563 [Streptococcus infantarius subsp. infantarius ATCC BAA-102]
MKYHHLKHKKFLINNLKSLSYQATLAAGLFLSFEKKVKLR